MGRGPGKNVRGEASSLPAAPLTTILPNNELLHCTRSWLFLKLITFVCYGLQKQGFDIYSEYCNNHPHAMAELKTLCESNKYKQFFEV